MFDNSGLINSISGYLIARIPEISFFLSATFMVFASDYIMENFLIRKMKRQNFISRTFLFLIYGLLILPALITLGAFLLRLTVLYPFQESIILVLAISFLIVFVA